jgi:hypothetical protein
LAEVQASAARSATLLVRRVDAALEQLEFGTVEAAVKHRDRVVASALARGAADVGDGEGEGDGFVKEVEVEAESLLKAVVEGVRGCRGAVEDYVREQLGEEGR